ncbi:hypothetical protein MtrunA17_Chr1g0156681 [Medicago truncatula]|uniref:Cathepsin propeptide inhibitor domain-containing protein n=1 Tax=Medicago truncatula TaxID=3880 RepID=A0A396JHA9_MEDTR|nr:hypothetical protein MtrunA17_Chr1g0156681 [Medicago truncatula]
MLLHQKNYSSALEFTKRRNLFKKKLEHIHEFNKGYIYMSNSFIFFTLSSQYINILLKFLFTYFINFFFEEFTYFINLFCNLKTILSNFFGIC